MDEARSSSSSSINTKAMVCSQEALDLLNCIAESSYDQTKCINLMQSLRQCVLDKKVKKFTLAEEGEGVVDLKSTKES